MHEDEGVRPGGWSPGDVGPPTASGASAPDVGLPRGYGPRAHDGPAGWLDFVERLIVRAVESDESLERHLALFKTLAVLLLCLFLGFGLLASGVVVAITFTSASPWVVGGAAVAGPPCWVAAWVLGRRRRRDAAGSGEAVNERNERADGRRDGTRGARRRRRRRGRR
jgi:hypothetical protein